MKVEITVTESSLHRVMRQIGYHSDREQRTGHLSFSRSIAGGRYPRFHIYYNKNNGAIDIHLDQKPNRYQGARDHGAEYSGAVLQEEVERIKRIVC